MFISTRSLLSYFYLYVFVSRCPFGEASGGDKPATLETGAVVTVPLFIQIGEKVVVDTTSGKYLKRFNEDGKKK